MLLGSTLGGEACDLCAINNAASTRPDGGRGFVLSLAQQFVPAGTVQLEGRQLPASVLDTVFLDSFQTHVVPTYNVSDRLGFSLNLPYVHRTFNRLQLTPTGVSSERGTEQGLGDVSAIVRFAPVQVQKMKWSFGINTYAGAKLPTGDATRVREEAESTRELDALYGVGHQHAVSGVHLRDLALGTGSLDGVFGLAVNSRWSRWFLNSHAQYYLRTRGESGYRYGSQWMLSTGPGAYLITRESFTVSVQALVSYDEMAPDRAFSHDVSSTGMRAWYLGPDIRVTVGEHASISAGVDLPISVDNRGLQNVPDFRFHGALSWRF
jgi:hypothetical protein